MVQKEYEDLMDKWDRFMRKSKPIMMSRTRSTRRAEELYMLEQLRHGLVSSIQEAEPNNKTEMKPIFGVAQSLSSLIYELLLVTHENLKENLTVTPRLVAGSRPLDWGSSFMAPSMFRASLQGLESRLAERLIGQDHVRFLISNALLRQRSGPRPVGSFLFLYGSGMGRTEHTKALAKQIFDNSDLLTGFDMSEYMDSDSVSRLIGVPSSYEECGAEGMLTEAVRRRPCSVILFDNVDMAHPAVVDVLIEILSHGRVLVDQGNFVDFTKTLIVLTSNAIDGNFRLWGCDNIWRSQDCPVKDNLEARRHFKPELFEKLDDVIVFKCLSLEQSMAIGRLQLRDIASSITGKKTYPDYGGENEIDDMSAVCIDALVGTKELSYRLENCGSYVEDLFLKHFKESFRELRVMYCKEKERINMIYTLRQTYFQLMNLLNANAVADFSCVADVVQKLLSTVDDLIRNTVDVNLTPSQNKLGRNYLMYGGWHGTPTFPVALLLNGFTGILLWFLFTNVFLYTPLNYSNEETQPTDIERPTKRAKNQVQGLCMVLCNRVVGQNQEAIDVVAEAVLKSILAPHDLPHRPTMSLLFLGLTRVGQADLVRSVAENFICDDGTDLLIQIDLSKYRDPDSLFQLSHGPLELPFSHSQHGVPQLEIVRMRPHSILLFSQVEMAHISVFSALLSVLDQGTLNNVDGHTEKIGFRYELLNQVDEIVLFNPFAREQLRKVARLSMRDGSHLKEGPPLALSTAFLDLFNAASDPIVIQISAIQISLSDSYLEIEIEVRFRSQFYMTNGENVPGGSITFCDSKDRKNNDAQLTDFVEAIKKMSKYVAQLRRVGKGHASSKGGALYALGLIHANHGEGIKQFLRDSLCSTNIEVIQHVHAWVWAWQLLELLMKISMTTSEAVNFARNQLRQHEDVQLVRRLEEQLYFDRCCLTETTKTRDKRIYVTNFRSRAEVLEQEILNLRNDMLKAVFYRYVYFYIL
ncbi:unnamed protein product [Camellia sinensis]